MDLSSAPNWMRRIRTELVDTEDRVQTIRQTVVALTAEVRGARGAHPRLDDRLAAIESRLDALKSLHDPL